MGAKKYVENKLAFIFDTAIGSFMFLLLSDNIEMGSEEKTRNCMWER